MIDNSILYRRLEPSLIACITARIDNRTEIPPLLLRLREACDGLIQGHPMVIFHGGAVKEGFIIEAAFPVSRPVENGEVHSRLLDAAPALTTFHYGDHQAIRQTILKVYDYLNAHAWTTSLFRREIYHRLDHERVEDNITEIQVILHEWDRLLSEGAQKVLGAEACRKLMQDIESITPASTFEEYMGWIQGAMQRLDGLTDDEDRKCRLVSHCAHVFPQERIDHLRGIYQQDGLDQVLREMYSDHFWYEKPVRHQNMIYMRKNPFNPDGYEQAATPAGRRKAYCHCPFVHPYLDEIPSRLSPTFCYCGAGWYRRLWEGILGQPVRIEQVETLLRGGDQCRFTITLPLELSGECRPDNKTTYIIRIGDVLDAKWGTVFAPFKLISGQQETLLTGEAHDQAELFGVLLKIRDLGLHLVAVNPVMPGDDPRFNPLLL
jgi:effector-binding domain-containing protein